MSYHRGGRGGGGWGGERVGFREPCTLKNGFQGSRNAGRIGRLKKDGIARLSPKTPEKRG